MKKFIKLIPALAMLLIATTLVSTATFAWFSMNNQVTVTGMTIHTKVNNNLLIAPYDASDTTYLGNSEDKYGNALHQVREALLEPSSTINGINYYYTSTANVDAQGDAIAESYVAYSEATAISHDAAGKTAYDAAFNTNYGFTTPAAGYDTVAYGYIDYVFYLKATNTGAAPTTVDLTKCNLLYQGTTTNVTKAWRVAMFVQNTAKETKLDTAIASTDAKTILTPASAVNQTNTNYAVGSATGTDDVKALSYGPAGTPITAYNQSAVVDSALASGATGYYKITIRLWLEGEDKECTNETFARLTEDYRLDLEFKLGATPVNGINSEDNATATVDSGNAAKATAALTNGETAASYAWMTDVVDGTDTVVAGATSAEFTATADGSYYCLITTEKGNVYRTNTVDLDVE